MTSEISDGLFPDRWENGKRIDLRTLRGNYEDSDLSAAQLVWGNEYFNLRHTTPSSRMVYDKWEWFA